MTAKKNIKNLRPGQYDDYFYPALLPETRCFFYFGLTIDSHTIDARIEKHACKVPLSFVIVATYLEFVSNHPF